MLLSVPAALDVAPLEAGIELLEEGRLLGGELNDVDGVLVRQRQLRDAPAWSSGPSRSPACGSSCLSS